MIQIYDTTRKLSLSNFKGSNYLPCPNCGKKRLKPYAYEDGRIESEILGRCQRESNCGYHLKPSDYFKDRGEKFFNETTFTKPIPKETYFLNKEMCEKLSDNFENSTLLDFFYRTGVDYTEIFQRYKVGANRAGSTVFFQYDGLNYRTGKIINYMPNGHRDKSDPFPVHWLHKLVKDFDESKQQIKQCFFGLHLVHEKNIICIVESEKTALLCAGLFPQAVWLATGGRTQLQAVAISELGSKRIILFPDTDSVVFWREKVKSIGRCEVVDTAQFNKYCKEGADLADYFLECGDEIARQTYIFVKNLLF